MIARPQRWVVGTAPDCDVMVDHPGVASYHCCLIATPRGFVLEDLQSPQGTFVNGTPVLGRARVTRGDRITLGPELAFPWPAATDPAEEILIHIGNAPDNDVVFDNPHVSPHHARIVLTRGEARIEDLGSVYGTALDDPGRKISKASLTHNQVVFFGNVRVAAASLLASSLTGQVAPHAPLSVRGASMTLGRDPSCDLLLPSPSVGSWHVRLKRNGDGILLEDLGSPNGTFVNGRRVRGSVRVRAGDVLGLGVYTFCLVDANVSRNGQEAAQATITARDVTVEVPRRRLLEQASLTVFPCELVGIMGASGAGKTTLMNALNGYTPPSAGEVLINGRSLYARYDHFAGHLGYVPQDDIIHRDLTVGQALYYGARLRLPSEDSTAIRTRIQAVLRQLGLAGAEHVLVGSPEKKGISGGQRKRVNLALELLTDPLILFLDEPTSGLSSEEALTVMRMLRDLADAGKTIILTIHQPSLEAFRMLDNLVLVSKDPNSASPGKLVYYGPAYPDAIHFFNPEGIANGRRGSEPLPEEVMRGLARRPTREWVARFAASDSCRDYVKDRAQRRPWGAEQIAPPRDPHFLGLHQWWTLVNRSLAIKAKHTMNTLVLLAQAPVIAVLLVLVYGKQVSEPVTDKNWQAVATSTAATLFLLALAALWFGCSNAVREIVGEWAVYHRERMVRLKIPAYVLSKLAVLGGLCLFQCAVLLGIVYWGCELKAPWWPLFGLLYLTALIGVGFGLLLSSLARTSEVAISLLPVVLLPMVILGGELHPIHKMNGTIQVVANTAASRWAFEGMLLLESEQRPNFVPPPPPKLPVPPGYPKDWQPPEVKKEDLPPPRDMAEHYFPREEHRLGPLTSAAALGAILLVLVVAIHLILRGRDVH